MKHFEDTWIGQPRGRTREPPIYPKELRDQHDATLDELPRGNNAVGGWHRGLDALTTRYHHSLWEIIENFEIEQSLTAEIREQDCSAGPPPKREGVSLRSRIG